MVRGNPVSNNFTKLAIGTPANKLRNNVFSLANVKDNTARQRLNNVNNDQAYKGNFMPNYEQYKKANTSQVIAPNIKSEQRTPSEMGRTLENISQITSSALLNAGIFAAVVQPELLPLGIATAVAGAGLGVVSPLVKTAVEKIETLV